MTAPEDTTVLDQAPEAPTAGPITIQVDANKQHTLVLTFAEVNVVLSGLGKIPAEQSYDIINNIRNQVIQQNTPAPAV